MSKRLPGLVLGLLLLLVAAAPAAAAGPATVTLRVEGTGDTVVPLTRLTTDTRVVNKDGQPGHDCTGTSAAGALEIATAGDWAGRWAEDFRDYLLTRVRGEVHPGDPDYWSFWLNNRAAEAGLCQTELQEGDEVLLYPDCFGPGCPPSPAPLGLTVPPNVRRGERVDVTVVRYSFDGTATPAPNARVVAGPASAVTDAQGRATLVFDAAGTYEAKASGSGYVRSAGRPVCVSEGAEGRCGTTDLVPPLGRITSIAEGQRFPAGRGPRLLAGTVSPDESGLSVVKLRLRRRDRGRCSYYSGRVERFRPSRCGRAFFFPAADRPEWEYLLPRALPRGRYVLDVRAIDRVENRDLVLERGRNRVVFTVG